MIRDLLDGGSAVRAAKVWCLIGFFVLTPLMLFSVVTNAWFRMPPKPNGDGPDYENIAFWLTQGSGYWFDNRDGDWQSVYRRFDQTYQTQLNAARRSLVATNRPPLLPSIVALLYNVLGRSELAFASVRLLNALCLAIAGALSVGLAVYLAALRQRGLVWVAGCGSLILVAANNTFRDYANDFLTEPLAALLTTLLVVWCVVRTLPQVAEPSIARKQCMRTAVVAGLLLGLMVLTRSMFVLWIPPVAFMLGATLQGRWLERAKVAAVTIGCAVLMCLPWWTHNVYALGVFKPLGTQGPITLLGGYCDGALAAGGDWQPGPEKALRAELASTPELRNLPDDTAREVFVSDVASRRVRQWVKEHRSQLTSLALQRVRTHWNPYSGQSLLWKALMVAGVLASFCLPRSAMLWLIAFPLLSTILAAVLYTTGGRFLVPLYGELFALAGFGLHGVANAVWRFLRPAPSARTVSMQSI